MAALFALKRASTSPLLTRFLNPIRSASVSRHFATNAQLSRNIGGDDLGTVDVNRYSSSPSRRRDREFSPAFFSDVVDPFSPTRSVTQLLNLMDQFMETPFVGSPRVGAATRRGWDVKEDENALYLSMDMPGLGKEDVKVSVDENTLVIKGEGPKESEEEESERRYSSRVGLPANVYKIEEIKAEMKNGVLKVVVPRVKEDERGNVVEVKVD